MCQMGPCLAACSIVIDTFSGVTNHKYNKACNSLFCFLAESCQCAAYFLLIVRNKWKGFPGKECQETSAAFLCFLLWLQERISGWTWNSAL